MGKDKLARIARVGHGEQRDEDDDDARAGPVDADLIDEIQVARAKRVDEGAHEHNRPKDEHGVPRLNHVRLVKHVNGRNDELRAAEINRQGNGPVADQRQPAVDEAHNGRPARGRQHGAPVVDAAGGRVDGADLGERGGDAERDDGDQHPAVEGGDGLAVDERVGHGGGEAVGDGHDGKGQAEDGQHGEIARQLRLVAEVGEGHVGLLVGGATVHGGGGGGGGDAYCVMIRVCRGGEVKVGSFKVAKTSPDSTTVSRINNRRVNAE